MTTIGLVLIFAAAVPATVVPVAYGLLLPWWRSWLGRAFMTEATALALVLDLSLAFRYWPGHDTIKGDVALAVYALIAAGCWMMLLAFCWVLTGRSRLRP